ncbi:MAG: hypothetical protein HDR11_11920 [Lachnospiraceae bacterium]|nr:hypothetical protein [Lachnospiraceae bacterium]MBD5498449.1 hypothetical protein [Lachnospiraceae bacterium]
MKRIKKIMVVLAALMIFAGNVGMTVSAAVDPSICEHPDDKIYNISYETPYTVVSTHPVWVANKPNGDPILATCTITAKWQKYKRICSVCQQEFRNWSEEISETHSMTH